MKVKVPIYGTAPAKATYVEQGATVGAQIGTNLLMPDGKVGTLAQLQALFGTGTTGDASTGGALNTTDDLDEGQWHLWFTDRRAQDAVGGILTDSANVTLAYSGGASITADLTELTDAGGGTLQRTAFDAYGRKTGSSAATTTDLAEGSNLYFTDSRAQAAVVASGITNGDTTHSPSGDAVFEALAGKEPAITAGTTAQYRRGDKTWRDFATDVRGAVLTGLSLATSAVIAATDTVLQAFGKLQAQITDNLLPAGYIDGLKMVWVSGTALTVTSGAAYIPGSGKVLRAASDIAKTGLSLTASTWYHVYLYDNAGTPDIEIVTTAPAAAYNGTARAKTGDTSRRYVGSVLTDASGSLLQFRHANGLIDYPAIGPSLRVLSAGAATVKTTVSCTSGLPVTATDVQARFINNAAAGGASLLIGPNDVAMTGSVYFFGVAAGFLSLVSLCPVDSLQAIAYLYTAAGGSGYIDINGYRYAR